MRDIFRNTAKFTITIFASVQLFSGCAYYNSYYNANKSYKKAIKIIENSNSTTVPGTAVSEFNIAIAKASRVLELYPNSRWADDAVLIIGKSFYYTGQNEEAKLKFHELILNFPYSGLVPETRLLYVKTLLADGQLELAEFELNQIVTAEKVKSSIKSEASLSLAELRYQWNDYEGAIDLNRQLISDSRDGLLKSNAQIMIAESFYMLENYEQAIEEYARVSEFDPPLSVLYESRYKLGKSLGLSKDYDRAINELSQLLFDDVYKENHVDLMLEIANIWELKGESEQSIYVLKELNVFNPDSITQDQYNYISLKAPSELREINVETDTSETAVEESHLKSPPKIPEALFAIGELYITVYSDLASAKLFYADALKAKPSQELKPLIDRRMKHINEISSLHQKLHQLPPTPQKKPVPADFALEPDLDSTLAPIDSLGELADSTTSYGDSILHAVLPDDMTQDSLLFEVDSTVSTLDSLQADSTESSVFAVMIDPFTSDSAYVPAFTLTDYDTTLYNEAMYKYNRDYTIYFNKLSQYNNNNAADLFRIAEIFLSEFDISDSTYKYLNSVIEQYPNSESAAKSYFTFIENYQKFGMADQDSLKEILLANYPFTDYARFYMSEDDRQYFSKLYIPTREDSIHTLFDEAEKLQAEGLYDASIAVYIDLSKRYYFSDYAPKSLFAVAWIYENELEDPMKAYEYYERLDSEYRSSDFSQTVSEKLQEARKIVENQERNDKLARLRAEQEKSLREKNFRDSVIIVNTLNSLENSHRDIFFTLEHDSVVAQPGRILTESEVIFPKSVVIPNNGRIIDVKILINVRGQAVLVELFKNGLSTDIVTERTLETVKAGEYFPATRHNDLPVQAWHFRRLVLSKK